MDGDDRTSQGQSHDLVWKALGDPTRRALLDELRNGRKSTSELVGSIAGMTRFGVMKHLAVLEQVGLVISRKEGRQRWNHLNAVPLRGIYERWVSKYEDQWAGSLVRLKQQIETKEAMSHKVINTPPRTAHVRAEIQINAPKEAVYRTWIDEIHNWFYDTEESRDTTPRRCQERIGGKVYIELPDDGFNVIGELTMLKPNHKIRIRGDCTMPHAVAINMTVAFEDCEGGTLVSVDHRMSGEFDDEFPAGFESGWISGLNNLKALIER